MKNPLDKGKLWEKRRRDRLKESFHTLAQLLPQYDPARVPSQKDILDKATQFVKELRLSNSRLLLNQTQADEKNKLIQELQDEVNRLILRVKQLTTLLKQANITIPSGPTIKSLGKRKLKWTDKLSPDDVENKKRLNNDSPVQSKEITKDSDTVCNGSASQVTAAPLRETNNGHPDKEPEIVLSPSATVPDEGNHVASFSAPPPQPQVLQSIAPMQTLTFSLPVQTTPTTTIILTPQALPVSPLLTRITVPAPRILPKPNASTRLPKLPIVRVTQPIIKVKRTRNRKKKTQPPVNNTPVENNKSDAVDKLQPKENAKENQRGTNEVSKPVQDIEASDKKDEPAPEPPVLSIPEVENAENEVTVIEATVTTVPNDTGNVATIEVSPEANPLPTVKTLELVESQICESSEPQKICGEQTTQEEEPELQIPADKPEIENPVVTPGAVTDTLTTTESPKEVQQHEEQVPVQKVSENSDRNTEATTEPVKLPEESQEGAAAKAGTDERSLQPSIDAPGAPDSSAPAVETTTAKAGIDESDEKSLQPRIDASGAADSSASAVESSPTSVAQKIPDAPPEVPPNEASVGENIPQSVTLSESLQDIADLMQPPPAANPPSSSKSNRLAEDSVVTTDKISECIARSIDLIDQPENELMELSGDWGEASSPKSPISPTQMFLSMFPLLPRESLIPSTEPSNNPKQPFNSGGKSSSFYIDSMLPDEQSSCSDNFSSKNTATVFPATSQVASTNLNIVNLLSTTTPSVEQLPSVAHSFGPSEVDADSSNPFSISSISTPIRSAIYPVSSSNTTAAKTTSASRASDFDFVLSPYSSLLSSTYNTNSTSKDMNWSPFTFSSSTRSTQPEVQSRKNEQAIPSSAENSNTPRKSKSGGKELSTYKPYANTGPVSREEAPAAVSSVVQQQKNATANQPERASTPKRSKNSSKSQSPARRQKDNSLSTPQKSNVSDTYTPYTFHHQHHQPYHATPVPPPPPVPAVVPSPSEAPFTPYFQPASLPDLSSVSRLGKGCVGKDQDMVRDTRKRSAAVVNTNNAPSCTAPSMDFGGANFYDNMLPQSMHSQFSLGHGSKAQRHNQPFYLPDVPLQNLDFMQHAIPPPHQILPTNKNSSRVVHQQTDKYSYFPPVATSQPGLTEFNYPSNLGVSHSGTQYHQHSQSTVGQSGQTSSTCTEKKSSSGGTAELSRIQNSSLVQSGAPGQRQSQNQGINSSQSQAQQHNQGQAQSQRQVRGKSPAQQSQSGNLTDQRQEQGRNSFTGRQDNNHMRSRDQSQPRGHSDPPQMVRPRLHQQHVNQALNGARASMQSEDQRNTSRNREGQHHVDGSHQARSEHHGQAQCQEQRPSGPNQNRSLQASNDGLLQQPNVRDHSIAASTSQPPHNVYNSAPQRDSQVQRGQEYQSSVGHNQQGLMQPQQSHPTSLQPSRGHVHQQPQGSHQQQQSSRRGNQKPDNHSYQQNQPQHVVQSRSQQGQNQPQQSQTQNQHQSQPHSNHSTSQGHSQQRIQQPQNHNNGQHLLHGHSQQPQGHSVAVPYQHQTTGSHSQSHHQSGSNTHSQGNQSQHQRQSHTQQPQGSQQAPQQQTKHSNQPIGPPSQSTTTRSYVQPHAQIHSHTQNSSLVANSSPSHPAGHSHNPHSQSHSQMYPPSNTSNTGAPQQQQQHHNTQNQTRPVNWMTDPPNRTQQQQSSSCNRKSNNPIPNPFSVSKLVGNSSSTSSQNSNNNNNYCVEGLIRKNNPTNAEWSDFSSPSSLSCIHSQTGSHNQASPTFSYQSAQPEYGNYGSFTHHSHPSQNQHHQAHYPSTSHFDQFGHHPHHHNQLRHHTSSSNNNSGQNIPLPHQHSTASDNSAPQQSHQGSSVLNFNLSSIFPEMNDKRNHPAGGSSSNNSRGCNNFYSGTK